MHSLNKITGLLLLFQFLTRLGFFIAIPYLAFYLTYLHFKPLTVGILVAAQPLFYGAGSLVLGFLGDRYGKKNMMVLATVLTAVASLGLAHAVSFFDYFFFCGFLGLSRSLFDSAMPAYLTDITPEQAHRFIFNLRFLVVNLASAFGPIIGVYFANRHSSIVFDISAVIYFICAVVTHFALNNDYQKNKSIGTPLTALKQTMTCVGRDKCLLLLIIGTLLYYFIYAQLEAPFAQALLLRYPLNATWLFGALWVLNSIIIVLFQLPLAALTEKVPLKTLNFFGVLFIMLCFIGLTFFMSKIALFICVALLTFGEMLLSPLTNIVIAQIAPNEMRSAYFGASSLAYFGIGFAPIAGSALLQFGNVEILFSAMAFISLFVFVSYHYCLKFNAYAQ